MEELEKEAGQRPLIPRGEQGRVMFAVRVPSRAPFEGWTLFFISLRLQRRVRAVMILWGSGYECVGGTGHSRVFDVSLLRWNF